ncbi:hypothetical protein H2200_010384 [Cladophialophora chaetospira]|uniref:Uncharacterized protein n=1 Tax=Cladophialophora chaetospira TaxID=386627 RepID=A0AA38X1D0_9EURO|nr:hypothetical protein H2200_010384 [Cladophialophora chaetospira]
MSTTEEIVRALQNIFDTFVRIGYISEDAVHKAPNGHDQLDIHLCTELGMNNAAIDFVRKIPWVDASVDFIPDSQLINFTRKSTISKWSASGKEEPLPGVQVLQAIHAKYLSMENIPYQPIIFRNIEYSDQSPHDDSARKKALHNAAYELLKLSLWSAGWDEPSADFSKDSFLQKAERYLAPLPVPDSLVEDFSTLAIQGSGSPSQRNSSESLATQPPPPTGPLTGLGITGARTSDEDRVSMAQPVQEGATEAQSQYGRTPLSSDEEEVGGVSLGESGVESSQGSQPKTV